MDVIEEEATEDIQQLGGSSPLEQPYFSVSIGTMVRKRVGWLLLLFFASTLSGSVVALFNTRLDATIMGKNEKHNTKILEISEDDNRDVFNSKNLGDDEKKVFYQVMN